MNPAGRDFASSEDAALGELVERVRSALAHGETLCIRGGGSKDFYGEVPRGQPIGTLGLAGISSYEPTELVVTARAGTRVAELAAVLAEKNQYLPFDPPQFRHFTADRQGATVGGMVAAGLSGPARAAVGAVRDYMLGATLLNGRAEVLSFGGQVMKNVAGYDVSRLLAGSMGTLGIILEVSLKVLPIPPATTTLRFDLNQAMALDKLAEWARQPLPLNASVWWEGALAVRLSGARAAVEAARRKLGGELIDAAFAGNFWAGLRDHRDEFFASAHRALVESEGSALWRLSVPQTAPPLGLSGQQLIEWGGGQRWLCTTTTAEQVREVVAAVGGHATLFAADAAGTAKAAGVFTPLKAPLDRIHREIKRSFDPKGVFNPGRLYPGF